MKKIAAVFLLVLILFRNAFSIGFFADDYFFLKISKISSISDFVNFFNPIKEYFYSFRPIPSEVFFWLINGNLFIAHVLVFITYIIGLIILYKIVLKLFSDSKIALIVVFMYAINYSHVFQLYWLATYQEVCLFTFLLISFFKYINKSYVWSWIFFILALLSKQSAIVYPVFLITYEMSRSREGILHSLRSFRMTKILIYMATSVSFYFIYKIGIDRISTLPEYAIQTSPKLILNNSMWYLLWSIGFPSVLPDYMTSILSAPIAKFWELFNKADFLYYQIFFIGYLFLNIISVIYIKKADYKKLLKVFLLCLFLFLVSIIPFVLVLHKWMVRLTVPLIFISTFNGYYIWLLMKNKKMLGASILVLYFLFNVFGIYFHEEASTYLIENRIFKNSISVFTDISSKTNCIYFSDKNVEISSWQGSKKLKTSYNDQSFIPYYFKHKNIKAVYSFEKPVNDLNCQVINSKLLFK